MTPQDMITHLEQGYTMSEIGAMCGKTRCAVSGLIYRYRKAQGIDISRGTHKVEVLPYTGADAKGFLEVLERNGCRYIAGDIRNGTAAYCSGANEERGYCKEHHARCYQGIKRKVGGV